MLEYSLIILSTVLFGGQFIALNAYKDHNGKSYRSIFLFCSVFSLTGAFVFLALTGFHLSFSVNLFRRDVPERLVTALLQVERDHIDIHADAGERFKHPVGAESVPAKGGRDLRFQRAVPKHQRSGGIICPLRVFYVHPSDLAGAVHVVP